MSHDALIEAMQKLGYKSNVDGICQGLAHMWMQAYFSGEEAKFNERVKLICSEKPDILKKKIEDTQLKLSELSRAASTSKEKQDLYKEKLNEQERKLLDIVAFFAGVELYQQPSLYTKDEDLKKKEIPGIFPKDTIQKNVETAAKMVASHEVETRMGIRQVHAEQKIKVDDSFKTYLSDLARVFKEIESLKKIEPTDADIATGITGYYKKGSHRVALKYSVPDNKWTYIDANRLPPYSLTGDEASKIILDELNKLGESINEGGVLHLNSEVYTTGNNPFKSYIQQRMKNYVEGRAFAGMLPDLHAAVALNQPESIEKLSGKKDFNELDSTLGLTPLGVAATLGNIMSVEMLMKCKADPYKPMDDGTTATTVAVKFNQAKFLRVLHKSGVDINKPDNNGKTPLSQAALKDSKEVIAILLQCNAKPNLPDSSGNTPLHQAVGMKASHMVNMLCRYEGIDCTRRNNDGQTPLDIGIQLERWDLLVPLLSATAIQEKKSLEDTMSKENFDILKTKVSDLEKEFIEFVHRIDNVDEQKKLVTQVINNQNALSDIFNLTSPATSYNPTLFGKSTPNNSSMNKIRKEFENILQPKATMAVKK